MAADKFANKDKHPGDADLRKRLGDSYPLFEDTLSGLQSEYRGICLDWKFSKTSGWYITGELKKKRLFYLFPAEGDFTFKMVFNDAALAEIRSGAFPKYIMEMIGTAKKYPEGTLCAFTKSEYRPDVVLELLRVKVSS